MTRTLHQQWQDANPDCTVIPLPKGTKETTVLKLNHREIKRLLDAVQSVHEPLSLSAWEDSDRRAHCKLIHRLQRADRRFSLYES